METIVEITSFVKLFIMKKPKSYVFKAGQASEPSITEPVWKMTSNVKCAMQAVRCFVNRDVLNRNLDVWLFYSRWLIEQNLST